MVQDPSSQYGLTAGQHVHSASPPSDEQEYTPPSTVQHGQEVGLSTTALNSEAVDPLLSDAASPAEDSSAPTAGEEIPGADMKSKTTNGDARDTLSPMSANGTTRGSLRSTSNKIASLRAAFEKSTSSNGSDSNSIAAKRRFPNGERRSNHNHNDAVSEKDREYWREIARLRDERDKEKELRQAYEDKCAVLEGEIEGLHSQLQQRSTPVVRGEDSVLEKDETEKDVSEKEDDEVDDVGDLHVTKVRSVEVDNLQRQLADLKRSISTSTRVDSQVTDSTFAQEMGVLCHETQNWIVNNFRRAKSEGQPEQLCSKLEGAVDQRHMPYIKPLYANFDSSAKLAIYQSTAMAYMLDVFSEPLLYGLPEQNGLSQSVHQTATALTSFLPHSAYQRWRVASLDAIRQSDGVKPSIDAAAYDVAGSICTVLSAVTETEPNFARRASLNSIIKRAISLAHLFRVQRAQYEFVLPTPSSWFDTATMIDDAEDGDPTPLRAIRCAMFPAVIKVGDEFGENIHLRNVVVKAKVLCTADA